MAPSTSQWLELLGPSQWGVMMSLQSHLLFFPVVCFLVLQEVFFIREKDEMVVDSRRLQSVQQHLGLGQLPLLGGRIHKLASSECVALVMYVLLHFVSDSFFTDALLSCQ
jgi:hypothetical protein